MSDINTDFPLNFHFFFVAHTYATRRNRGKMHREKKEPRRLNRVTRQFCYFSFLFFSFGSFLSSGLSISVILSRVNYRLRPVSSGPGNWQRRVYFRENMFHGNRNDSVETIGQRSSKTIASPPRYLSRISTLENTRSRLSFIFLEIYLHLNSSRQFRGRKSEEKHGEKERERERKNRTFGKIVKCLDDSNMAAKMASLDLAGRSAARSAMRQLRWLNQGLSLNGARRRYHRFPANWS